MADSPNTKSSALATVLALAALGVCGWLLFARGINPPKEVPPQAEYSFTAGLPQKIPAKLLQYEQIHEIPTGFDYPAGMTLLNDRQIAIIGDTSLRVFEQDGKVILQHQFKETPQAIASWKKKLVVVLQNSFLVGEANVISTQTPIAIPPTWLVTSAAMNEKYIAIADATNPRAVLFDHSGKHIRDIGGKTSERPAPQVPSPYFATAFSPQGYLLLVDPGRHKVQAYTMDDKLEFAWGKSGIGISDFSGCCNPTNLAILSDGSVVTSEKGTPRVKVYDPGGTLNTVVAAPDLFDPTTAGIAVAADSSGTIYALDPQKSVIRIFRRKDQAND